MSIKRINEFPSGVSSLTNDDLFLIMDSPNGTQTTKQINASGLRSYILSEPANLQFNRGTSTEVNAYIPLEAEPVYATDTKVLSIGDGNTLGGIPLNGTYQLLKNSNPQYSCFDCIDPLEIDSEVSLTLSPPGSIWAIETTLQFSNPDLEASSANGAPVVDFTSTSGIKYISAVATTRTIVSGNMPINILYKDLTVDNTTTTFTKYYVPWPSIATIYEARANYLVAVTSGTPIFGLKFRQVDAGNPDDSFVRTSGILTAKRIV